jgi:C-terminal processing protease CtpA/Prc
MGKKLFIFLLLLIVKAGIGRAQVIPDNTEGRLWRLCKVWGYMKFYSPNTCRIRWDSLINATIPLVQHAASNDDFNERILDMFHYVEQIPPALATPVPAADSNLNLQLDWTNDNVFSAAVRGFLDTFESRAGRNDSLGCRIVRNNYADPGFNSYIDARNDEIDLPVQTSIEKDRLTVLFQYWNTYQYLGPYRQLNSKSWDSTLLQAIAAVRAAGTARAFHFALAKAQSDIGDSHARYISADYSDSLGNKYPGIMLRKIEGKTVVGKVHPDVTGVTEGDIVTKIDGIPVVDVENGYRDYFSSSNEAAFYRDVYRQMARSNSDSKTFELLDASGQPYTKTVLYNLSGWIWGLWAADENHNPVWTTLCNGYGYVNLGKLMPAQVGEMYAALKDKEAIVFDVRNYPNGTLWSLAPLLFPGPVTSARFFVPDLTAPGRFSIQNDYNNLGSWNNPVPYGGKLYFLVNETTQSHAEYTVQYLSHVPGAKVIGSQTAGADGNIAYFKCPGFTHYFTSLGWYYDDWYQCQRNGIKIDEVVTPTIQGFKEGRDEVLEHVSGCFSTISRPDAFALEASVYPSPATGKVSVNIRSRKEGRVTISISDITGNTLFKREAGRVGVFTVKEDIDIGNFSAGIYLVKVSVAGGGGRTLKLVKK